MFPKLLEYQNITIYTYAICIAFGTLLAVVYTKWQAKKTLDINLKNSFFYIVFIAGFIGGKIFLFFEKPLYYIQNPQSVFTVFSGGFVFYGSFICITITIIWYLKKHKILVLPMLDILALTTTIVHSIGRLGCFFAGCCYGKETNSIFGITFSNTGLTTVHPTQLYEVFAILVIMNLLLIIKKRKRFNGQIFICYVVLYGIVRSFLEVFRGDNRGFIIEGFLSHSQFIAACLIIIISYFYIKLNKKKSIN
ncbi:prolipoprotein diacylglyceryl transferase [Tenacibaculum haliotis]|uniref:prolipoprotein diacylglyceryl transferase n=1 Tax=Tenacibaculum haliotis TaxID=1888914 RepID=UPI0021AF111D|nr:prolipoprotein diacylglyceryl transferase [Tenacibaculum haliotis]MCT4699430.1 prolipoprotein diacylglyceryl transferase [Tenacibaculum haliotis]